MDSYHAIRVCSFDPQSYCRVMPNPQPLEKQIHSPRNLLIHPGQLYESISRSRECKKTGLWWSRQWTGDYFPVVSLDMPEFRASWSRRAGFKGDRDEERVLSGRDPMG